MKRSHLVALLGMNLLWAASYPINKALEPDLDSAQIVTLRYGLAAVCLLLLWPLLPGRAPRGRDLRTALLMGVLVFSAAQQLQVAGIHLGSAGDAALLIALDPLMTALAAALILRERIAPRRWFGFGLGVAGALLLSGAGHGQRPWPTLAANGLILLSLACEAAYSTLGKPLLERAGGAKILTVALLSGTTLNLLVAGRNTLAAAALMPPAAWELMAYLVLVCTLVGYTLWFTVIRLAEVNAAALTIFVQPLAGLALARLWLEEPLHWGQLWGGVAILAALVLGLPTAPGRAKPSPARRSRD